MEKIENEAVVEETTTEVLEDNATEHGNESESEQPSGSDAESSDGKTLSDSEYQEYRKLKRLSEKGNLESRQEGDQKEVSNSVELEELVFANAGITDETAKEAARKLVRLGEAKNLMEAAKDEFVMNKQSNASEEQAHRQATPRPSQRVPSTRKDSAEYWIEKGEMPEDQNLKLEVIKKKREMRKKSTKFGSGKRSITIQ